MFIEHHFRMMLYALTHTQTHVPSYANQEGRKIGHLFFRTRRFQKQRKGLLKRIVGRMNRSEDLTTIHEDSCRRAIVNLLECCILFALCSEKHSVKFRLRICAVILRHGLVNDGREMCASTINNRKPVNLFHLNCPFNRKKQRQRQQSLVLSIYSLFSSLGIFPSSTHSWLCCTTTALKPSKHNFLSIFAQINR